MSANPSFPKPPRKGGRRCAVITATPEDIAHLHQFAAGDDIKAAQRAKAILASIEGKNTYGSAAAAGLTTSEVTDVRFRWHRDGVSSLERKKRVPRNTITATPSEVEELRDISLSGDRIRSPRAMALLMSLEGRSTRQAAAATGLSEGILYALKAKWPQESVACLRRNPVRDMASDTTSRWSAASSVLAA